MSDARTVKPGGVGAYHTVDIVVSSRLVTAFTYSTGVPTPAHGLFVATNTRSDVCGCGAPLLFSARQRGDGMCGPCSRGASFRTIAVANRVNHDPGDEDR